MKQKHMDFAIEYLSNGYNAVNAYLAIYPGSTKSSADSNAYKLLKRPDIKEFVDERRKEIFDSKMIDATRWASEVIDIAFAAKGDVVYTTGDKLKALQMIQKYLGLDVQKQEIKQEIFEVDIIED